MQILYRNYNANIIKNEMKYLRSPVACKPSSSLCWPTTRLSGCWCWLGWWCSSGCVVCACVSSCNGGGHSDRCGVSVASADDKACEDDDEEDDDADNDVITIEECCCAGCGGCDCCCSKCTATGAGKRTLARPACWTTAADADVGAAAPDACEVSSIVGCNGFASELRIISQSFESR